MEFKEYRDEINHIFAAYSRRGFVDYYNCRGLWSDMINLMTEAIADLESQGQYKELFDLANKAFLKWAKTDKDDSDGETQDFVCYIFDAWDAVYAAENPKVTHAKMLDWFLKNLDGSVIDYMEDELYKYMMEHFKEKELLEKKRAFLETKIEEQKNFGDHFQVEYHMPKWQEYLLSLMGELDYPIEEIRAYATTIKSHFVKERLAQVELSYGNTDEAIAIYEELAKYTEGRRGRNEYHEILKRIYKELGDYDKYFDSLKKAMFSAVGDTELWREYKSCFDEKDWAVACKEIFYAVKMDHRAVTWYEEEDRFDLIMDTVEAYDDTELLKHYEKKLKKLYVERCLNLIIKKTEETAEEGNKRSDYRRLAGLLNWIMKYPNGDEITEKLAREFREAYPRRRAMLEEIEKF